MTVDENITISANDNEYSLQLQIVDNSVVENTESFVLSLSLPRNQQVVQLGTYDSTTIRVMDDDSKWERVWMSICIIQSIFKIKDLVRIQSLVS